LPIFLLFLNFIRIVFIPTSPTVEVFDFIYDLMFFYVLSGFDALTFILVASIGFKSKFSKFVFVRELLQICAVEIALGTCLVAIAFYAGTLNIRLCVYTQIHVWFIFVIVPFGILFFISILGELHRVPFDTIEAEAELTAGYQTEFGGTLFSLFYLSEYLTIINLSILFSNLFFGNYSILPFTVAFLAVFIFIIRAALPRIRIQSLLNTF
jgi:NADH:ubiquinone oxidoreductase subunit H